MHVLLPEIFLLSATCAILLLDLMFKSKKLVYFLSQGTLFITLGLSLYLFQMPISIVFDNAFILDPLASVLKILIEIMSIFVFWVSREYVSARKMPFTEFYLLGLFAILGMMLLVSSHHFIVLFLALELSALPVYALVALWQDSPYGSEASMKYFVMGALSSGMLLYGLSMIYGATGSLIMTPVVQSPHDLLLVFGLVFVLAGIAFKFGAAPFHLWVPDIYTGAPTCVTLFISAAPKIAALGMTFRLLLDALPTLQPHWQQLFIVVALASMGLGNFAAIMQTNLKRMLAYSSIAHMGYLSLGFIAGTADGYSAALFYMLSYGVMVIGAFGLLVLLSVGKEIEQISDLKGLNSKNPWLAFMFLLILFSMAGIPPTVGFFAKLTVLEALIATHFVWLAVVALIFAVVGAYYYINVIKVMYFEAPDDTSKFVYSRVASIPITVAGIGVLVLGALPGALIYLAQQVF
jgi:NADH-quinone oxidoreductase subunit N